MRDPQKVLEDVRQGKVSAARAREVYRVVVDTQTWTVEAAQTEGLRSVPAS